jgi:MBOAT, membrane-bound O-acyltransferase family
MLLQDVAHFVSGAAGLREDEARFVVSMLASYPLGLLFAHLIPPVVGKGGKDQRATRALIRHVFGALVGLFVAWECFEQAIMHFFFIATGTYVLARFLPRNVQHKVAFMFAMGYMSAVHIYRMYTGYLEYRVDFSGPMMVITIKVITFAFDYHDGGDEAPVSANPRLKAHQTKMALKELPSLLEYYAYVLNFSGLLAGPAVNFGEYRNWIDGSVFDDAPEGTRPDFSFGKIVAGLKQLAVALFCGGMLQVAATYAPLGYVHDPAFMSENFFYRAIYLCVATAWCRFGYYFAWYLSEGACIWSGLGYEKWDKVKGRAIWTRASNVHIMDIELAQNFHQVTSNWNVRTNDWLKYYVTCRVPAKWSVHLTMLCSASWHGFYPGYYLSFGTASGDIMGARLLRSKVRSLFVKYEQQTNGTYKETPKPSKPVYDAISVVFTFFALNYTMSAFMLLGWEFAITAWSSVYFWFHGVIILGLIALNSPLPIWGRIPRAPRPKSS